MVRSSKPLEHHVSHFSFPPRSKAFALRIGCPFTRVTINAHGGMGDICVTRAKRNAAVTIQRKAA